MTDRPPSFGFWLGFVIVVAIIVLIGIVATARQAAAHDWYIGTGCCYGEGDAKDCDPVPFGSIREVKGGFIITLTKDQMLRIRPRLRESKEFHALKWGISEFFPERRARPAMDGGYSVCLKQTPTQEAGKGPLTWALCFFFPTNT